MIKEKFKRSLSLFSITMYGIGSILGAGIYVLVGKVSGHAGIYAPLSFFVAAIIAAFTAISYANLSSIIPKSGGEFAYINQIFKSSKFAFLIAAGVMLSGIISSATMANGFVGYLRVFFDLEQNLIIAGFILILGLLSIWGIKEAAWVVTSFAIVEFCGLLFVVFCLKDNFALVTTKTPQAFESLNYTKIIPILSGAFLAFFAYIGFEDMVNVAEEVKNPKRNMYLSIIFALIVTSSIYIIISLIASLSLTPEQLQGSAAPMADLIKTKGYNPKIISVVSLFSIANGAIVQMVMAARILFSIARKGMAPALFGKISSETKTPISSTIAVIVVILSFALFLELETLAEITSFVILSVFSVINFTWLVYQLKHNHDSSKIIPLLGTLTTSGMIIMKLFHLA